MKNVFFIYIFLFAFAVKAQIKHTVTKGETIYQIAKKYQVTPFDIYRLNPDAKIGVQENTTLLIPKAAANSTGITHKVAPKETLFGIAKKYNVSISDIEKWNKEALQEGLKIDLEIYVSKPMNYPNAKREINTESSFKPNIISTSSNTVIAQEKKVAIAENKQYQVQPKETLYSLSKKFNITQDELIRLNPDLQDGLKIGMILQVPFNRASLAKANDSILNTKDKVDLFSKVIKTNPKNMVLLLPFNMNKIDTDSIKTRTDHIKTNKFLNLTLDYYAGALMAIDSAKVLGLPINVKVYDVESTKYSSNVAAIIAENNFENVDVVIGPFQNSMVETTAQLLAKYNIPVISPLSKERGLPLSNLYYSVPAEDRLRSSLFDYFKSKNGNVVAVISTKKTTSKDFILANYPEVKHTLFNDKGALDLVLLKKQLVKGKKNFVLMEIEKASTVVNLTKNLIELQKEYDIQLAVFEVYDTLNFEEISINNLAELKMLFPSTTKVVATPEEKIFEKEFKRINNVYPNAVAKKGFDVTFDALLRICQPEGFVTSAATTKTEYIESAFDYNSNNGLISNNASYLLYYDTDLTIKQAQ